MHICIDFHSLLYRIIVAPLKPEGEVGGYFMLQFDNFIYMYYEVSLKRLQTTVCVQTVSDSNH